MTLISNPKRLMLYKDILSYYPAEVKRYVINCVLKDENYNPDITTLVKVSENKNVETCLWFDLHNFQDLFSFIPFKFHEFSKKFVEEIDIAIIGFDNNRIDKEFFLEFRNEKISVADKIVKDIESRFSYKLSEITEKINKIKSCLDQNNYFICGIKYSEDDIKEVKFCFNINEKMLLSTKIPSKFLQLLKKFGLNEFRAEKSYIVKNDGTVVKRIGWMVDCNFLPNFDTFVAILSTFFWTKPLIERLHSYAKESYAPYLRWGWFSYLYSKKDIQAINLALNYDDGK